MMLPVAAPKPCAPSVTNGVTPAARLAPTCRSATRMFDAIAEPVPKAPRLPTKGVIPANPWHVGEAEVVEREKPGIGHRHLPPCGSWAPRLAPSARAHHSSAP